MSRDSVDKAGPTAAAAPVASHLRYASVAPSVTDVATLLRMTDVSICWEAGIGGSSASDGTMMPFRVFACCTPKMAAQPTAPKKPESSE